MAGPSRQTAHDSPSTMERLLPKSNVQKGVYLLLLAAAVYAIVMTITNWWVCDDAFISFRYAKNLVDGHGLIFNIGEKVEGYSNFLWTIMVAVGMKVSLDPVPFSLVLGGLSFLAVVIATGLVSYRLTESGKKPLFLVPIAALLLMLHHDMHVYATSGLETMFTTALMMFGFLTLITARDNRKYLLAGFLLTLTALARPDGLLFTAMGGLFVLIAERRFRPAIAYALPVLLLYLPYWIWRYQYYGYVFPNTYYAKSGDLSYWSQGWVYLWVYLKSYYLLLTVAVAIAVVIWMRVSRSIAEDSIAWRAFQLALLFVIPYVIYIVKVGGDFMFARFWIVITPLLFLLIELPIRLIVRKQGVLIATALLLAATVILRLNLYADDPKAQISGIANEPAYYPPSHYAQAKIEGERLRSYLAGTEVKLAFRGQHAMQIYYSEVPIAIESATGLTDSYIAHLLLKERGRPGHEKMAPVEYLKSRGVDFMLVGVASPKSLVDSLTQISFDGQTVRILQYEGKVMERLKKFPEVRFMDIPSFLDQWIAQIPSLQPDLVENSFLFFQDFYFRPTPDPDRLARFSAAVQRIKRP
jgi:hypothetical protein